MDSLPSGSTKTVTANQSWCKKPVLAEHVTCIGLPSPLDRLFLLLHREDRPQSGGIDQICRSNHPPTAFANVLLGGGVEQQDVIKCFTATDKAIRHPGFTKCRRLASLAALFGHCAEKLNHGPLEWPDQDL